jgi:glycosyltransferase involved in cell wall biosynthesis
MSSNTWRVAPQKVFAIHNGFDPGVFQPVHDAARLQEVRARYKLPEQFILWAGQIESRKNVARLLQAFRTHQGCRSP